MLDLAAKYETELQLKFAELGFKDEYKYYWNYGYRNKYKATESTWNEHEFISKSRDEINGYLAYSIDRETYSAHSLKIINFNKSKNSVFALDLSKFLVEIFEKFKFNKLNYSVVIGNPIEKSYDKMTTRYGGRIVGIKKNEVRLIDGSINDLKLYEILREEYLSNKKMK